MIDWILRRFEEGLSNEYYDKGKKEESIESMFLCEGYFLITLSNLYIASSYFS